MIPKFQMASNTRILIIDNNDSFTYNLLQLAEECGGLSCEVVGEDSLDPWVVSDIDKVLISPGPGLPTDYPRMCEVIRRFGSSKDILGICLGHQAIAMEYGASLLHMSNVKHGITSQLHFREDDKRLFAGVPESSLVGLYHSWCVDSSTLPGCLDVTAVADDGLILAIRHKKFKVRGVQFHPESFMTPTGRIMIKNWIASE